MAPLPPRSPAVPVMRLVTGARRAVAEAHACHDPLERYAFAHLGALRAAAAVVADRVDSGAGTPARRRPTSVWTLLSRVAPELRPWSDRFASGAGKRAAAEAGLRGAASAAEADELLRATGAFLGLVEATLGLLPLPVVERRAS